MAQTDLINEGLLADYHDELMKDHIVGGTVFDISSYHATGTPPVLAKYANLSAALGTNGANIPEALRKGGMSVKFVQSIDNKYVQYRLMSDEWSATEANWQGVDEEPTAGSENLVKSGGVKNKILNIIGVIVDKSINVEGTTNTPTGITLKIGVKYTIYVQCSTAVTGANTGVYVRNSSSQFTMIKQISAEDFAEGCIFEYIPSEDVSLYVRPFATGTIVVKVWDEDIPLSLIGLSDVVDESIRNIVGPVENKLVNVSGTDTTSTGITLKDGVLHTIYVQCSTTVNSFNEGVWVKNSSNQFVQIKYISASEYSNGYTFDYTPSGDEQLYVRLGEAGTVTVKVWNNNDSVTLMQLSESAIVDAILSESFRFSNLTNNSDGILQSANITWPDGDTGTMTVTYTNGLPTRVDYTKGIDTYRQIITYNNGEFVSNSIAKI